MSNNSMAKGAQLLVNNILKKRLRESPSVTSSKTQSDRSSEISEGDPASKVKSFSVKVTIA